MHSKTCGGINSDTKEKQTEELVTLAIPMSLCCLLFSPNFSRIGLFLVLVKWQGKFYSASKDVKISLHKMFIFLVALLEIVSHTVKK